VTIYGGNKMKRLILSLIFLGMLIPVYAADSYKEQLRQFKLIYIELLEKKIEKIPTGTTIEVFLKNGTTINGILKEYCPYSDALWIQPLNRQWGIFSDKVYDIRQIQDVTIVIIRSI
jgi:hypothetical protein